MDFKLTSHHPAGRCQSLMHSITSPTEPYAPDRLTLADFIVATLASLAAILDFFTFAPLTEIFVNRHYEFRSFSLEDCQRPGRTRIPFLRATKDEPSRESCGEFRPFRYG